MQNFRNTFETRKRSFISAFLICMAVSLMYLDLIYGFRDSVPVCKLQACC